MKLRDLAVHVDHREDRAQGLALAVELAAHCDAHLTGVYVDPVPVAPELIAMSAAPELLEAISEEADDRVRRARAAFDEHTRRADVRGGFLRGDGPMYPALAEHARYSDLLVVTQDGDGSSGPVLGGFADYAVLDSGRPVLVVPFIGAAVPVGGTAIVAWSGARESARAVNDALPLLALAEQVEVVVIRPEDTDLSGAPLPGAALCEHLARHGLKAEARVIAAAGSSAGDPRGSEGRWPGPPLRAAPLDVNTGDLLLSHAADVGANLIVMGAYGHSRLREMVLGGVTRHLLLHMTVPVLMSH